LEHGPQDQGTLMLLLIPSFASL